VDKTTVIYITFLCGVASQKLVKSANDHGVIQKNTGTVF